MFHDKSENVLESTYSKWGKNRVRKLHSRKVGEE